VGIVAAQSIGEPGTQLTMRTFHTGGSASVKDITQGLPRVEELFEAREPKGQAYVSEIDGQVYIAKPNNKEYIVRIQGEDVTKDTYDLGKAQSTIKDGSKVESGETLYIDEGGKAVKAKTAGWCACPPKADPPPAEKKTKLLFFTKATRLRNILYRLRCRCCLKTATWLPKASS